MNCRVACSLALSVFLGTATAFSQQPPSAVLALDPSTTLPGLPVAFVVTIANPSDHPITFMNAMKLRVTTASGTFMATGLNRDQVDLPSEVERCAGEPCVTVAAHGQKQLYVNFGPHLTSNEFFEDARLATPGTYTLQLVLYVEGPAPTEVISSPAILTIRQPEGIDAQVWQFMRGQTTGGVWSLTQWALNGDLVAPKLRADFPTSGYIPWVAGLGRVTPPSNAVNVIDGALAMNPTPSLLSNLLWTKAATLAAWSNSAIMTNRNVNQCIEFADQARDAYQMLAKFAPSDALKQIATDALKHLYSPATADEELRQLSAGDPPAPAVVVPKVECVSKGAGRTFTATFGYVNPNRALKVLQIGNLNQITPAPRDQGQPRVFKPGDHPHVFTASSDGGELKWHLDGTEATATADFAVQCVAQNAIAPKTSH